MLGLLSKLSVQVMKEKKFYLVEIIGKTSFVVSRQFNSGIRFEFATQKKPPQINTVLARLGGFLIHSAY